MGRSAMPWMVVRTEPQRELLAQDRICKLGYHPYHPKFRDWFSGKIKSLFPRYLFVEFHEHWGQIRRAHGVHSVLCSAGTPGIVEDEIIDDLKAKEDSESLVLLNFDIGHVVTVIDGEMKGWTGIFNGMNDRDRCEILFSMMNRPITKLVSTKFIRAGSPFLEAA